VRFAHRLLFFILRIRTLNNCGDENTRSQVSKVFHCVQSAEDERFGVKFLIRFAHKNLLPGLGDKPRLARLYTASVFRISPALAPDNSIKWQKHFLEPLRRMRDSNSRRILLLGGLVNRWFQPLTQSSNFPILSYFTHKNRLI
jgi:hypothetical protein